MPVAVIGDAALDVTVRAADAPRPGGDVPARISLSPGGQGANVAVRLARAGIEVRLVAAMARDPTGRLLSAALEADAVAVIPQTAVRSSLVVSLVDASGERAMLSDRVSLDPSRLAAACAGATWVHCSGYALADDASGDALAEVLASLPSATRVSLAGGSMPPGDQRAARARQRATIAGVDLMVMSRDEAGSLLDRQLPSLPAAADALAAVFRATVVVVTGGAAGSAAAGPGFALSVPAPDPGTPSVDATGAGDAYVAAIVARLVGAEWPPDVRLLRDAMEHASREGAQVARLVGAQRRTMTEAPGA